jgi:hypothetical protein
MAARFALVAMYCGFTLAFVTFPALAEELSLGETAWNGLSDLRGMAEATGVAVITPSSIDVATLGPEDALLVVHPVEPLPSVELSAFLRSGGRMAIADDYGTGGALMAAFGIGLHSPLVEDEPRMLRGRRHLLLASRQTTHPLSQSASDLVTNHPQVLGHRQLDPIYALGRGRNAIVLTGAVGNGRLVAISDASLFINNMLLFEGNRGFARDLLAYLTGSGRGRLYLVASDARWNFGLRRFSAEDPLESVRAILAYVARLRLPPSAIVAMSVVLALLLAIAVVTALPKRSVYARRRYLEIPETPAGFAGQVDYYRDRARNFLPPLLAFKFELESRILSDLALRGQLSLAEVLRALRERGLPERSLSDTRELLVALDATQSGTQGATPRISPEKFSELVSTGRRILAEIDAVSRRPTHD